MVGHSHNGVNSGSKSRGYGKKTFHGSGRGSPPMREGFTECGNRVGQSSTRGGFAEHGSRGGRSLMRGGFSTYGGRGGFMGMLNNIDGYYPQMPDQEWSEQHQEDLLFPDLTTVGRYQPRNSHSLPSRASGYHLQDHDDAEHEVEEPVEDEHEVEGEPEGEYDDDNVSIPSPVASHTPAAQETTKVPAFIRANTIDVLEPSGKCSRVITQCFRWDVDIKYLTWGDMPLARKNQYFEEFRDSSQETAIRGGWDKKATLQFASFTSAVRNSSEKPVYILEDVYNNWMERWGSDQKFQERCAKMRVNRGRADIHNGGSRSFFNTADHLKEKLKVDDIPAHTLFEHNHSKTKDGVVTWSSSKAMRVDVNYQCEVKKQKQENVENGTPIDENAAYLKAAGGVTKSGVYGVDKRLYYGSCSTSSSKSRQSSGSSIVSEVERLSEGLRLEKAKTAKIEKMMAQWAVMFRGMPNLPIGFTDDDPENANIGHTA